MSRALDPAVRAGLILPNPALERMRRGEVALGMVVRLGRTGDIARIAAATGHDFVFIDMQHAAFTVGKAAEIAQAARGCGVTALARVRSADDPNIALLLDCGVMGVVVPGVGTVAVARTAIAAARFAPIGRRSLSTPHTTLGFLAAPHDESMRAMNVATLVGCMIETVEGVANVEAIAALDGIDVLHLGCTDLMADMGRPGDLDHPELAKAIDRVISAARSNGKFAGVGGVRDIGRLRALITAGAQFVTVHSDVALVIGEGSRRLTELRSDTAASVLPA